ncbi:lactose-binding lectin l-2-like [Nematolebias whitei]|uniref:lactose-binding lectin l-2-like n=1 Tax=Nematolebias whitei TaxID=451745 RepID=UPI00189B1F2C|nr:lactose-binding lectin l-2-like [Nematolebias whitei]
MFIFEFFILFIVCLSPSDGQELKLQRSNCPMFWFSFNGRCYKYVATPRTWGEAELQCVSEKANLVSIHSLEEHQFVEFLTKNFDPSQGETWIGLTDVHKEGGWMWSDGCKYSFTHWKDHEPNNQKGIEHCGQTNYGEHFRWNDIPCSKTYPFVCASRIACPK